jgi:hypothetical protein
MPRHLVLDVLLTGNYLGDFAHCAMNGEVARKAAQDNHWLTGDLQSAPLDRTFVVPVHDEYLPKQPEHPAYYLVRSHFILEQSVCRDIGLLWQELRSQGPVISLAERNRSNTPALHLGVWDHMQGVSVTAESRVQTPEVIQAMDRLLSKFKEKVVPRLDELLKLFGPAIHVAQHRCVITT